MHFHCKKEFKCCLHEVVKVSGSTHQLLGTNFEAIYILVMQCFRVVYRGISHESLVFSS